MDKNLKKIMGDGPYPFRIENIADYLDIYLTGGVCITESKSWIDFGEDPKGHQHNSYEFLIPFTTMAYLCVENEKFSAGNGYMLPMNPGQYHGTTRPMDKCKILDIGIDKNYMDEVSFNIWGKKGIWLDNRIAGMSYDMKYHIHMFIEEHKRRQAGYQFILDSLGLQIAVSLLRQFGDDLPGQAFSYSQGGRKNINRVIEFLRECYDRDYTLEDLAKLANLSIYHFIRVFKAETGKTPFEYLLDVKIEKAREMLRLEETSVSDVCFACGFNNISHFATVFKKKTGASPTEYRKLTR